MSKPRISARRNLLAWLGVAVLATTAAAQYNRLLPEHHRDTPFMRSAEAVSTSDERAPVSGPTPADLAVYLELHRTRDIPETAPPLPACR